MLLVGTGAGSPGGDCDGAEVRIDDEWVQVKAKVVRIRGFSGHADRDQLIDFVAHGGDKAKQVFVTMGEALVTLLGTTPA